MLGLKFRMNIFSRFSLSYMIIFTIPLFILGAINYTYTNRFFADEIVDWKI